jgi:flagellar L-ring protein precursor FlgH
MTTVTTWTARIAVVPLAVALGGCNMLSRLANVGQEPPMTTIQNPVAAPAYRPVSMPMPSPRPDNRQANSLWRAGSRAFFKDQRAGDVGDILTVLIQIEDKAELSNTSTRSRANSEDASLNAFLGYESSLNRVLPQTINPGSLIELDSQLSNNGAGTINRDESIQLKVAAVISQVLPNGNLVVHGRQEVRVNFEVRELQIAGIIRPEDVTAENTISYEKVAEARISYGGRGHISDVQQPRYGQQILDIIFPF